MITNDLSMADEESRDHIELVLQVARYYYQNNLSESAIAKKIGYSRPTVSRFLQEARNSGMVHIEISHPLERLLTLERQLIARFNLKYARVAEVRPGRKPEDVVPHYAASLLIEKASPNSLITVSNGRAVAATVREVPLQNWPKSNVAQMVGAVSPSNTMADSPDICRMLATKLGGTFTALHVPIIMSSSHMAEAMRKEPQIATALALGGAADVALEGVGAVTAHGLSPIFDAYVSGDMLRKIREEGAVGTVCGHMVDAQGNHVHTELCDRTMSVDIERLKKIPLVIGVAWGEEKIPAIHACLIGHFLSALVTDRSTAEELLAWND